MLSNTFYEVSTSLITSRIMIQNIKKEKEKYRPTTH
jgi:hypothetical protein